MKDIAIAMENLARELGDCTAYDIVDNLVGMLISEEEASQIKEILSGR
jgi:hypothetical protein